MDLTGLARKLRTIFGPLPTGFPDEWQLTPVLHVNGDGWLEGDGVQLVPAHASWFYPKLSTPTGDPRAIVWHVSATNPGTARTMAKHRVVPRRPEDRAASWHISIEADGGVTQMVSLEAGAWHALNGIKGVGPANRTSASVELVGWERGPFPELQVIGACRVARAIVRSYGIPRELANVAHADIDPGRRSDPGKLWLREHAPNVMSFAYA